MLIMPMQSAIVIVSIVAAFTIYAATLAWADFYTVITTSRADQRALAGSGGSSGGAPHQAVKG
jgi:hypothetical protein